MTSPDHKNVRRADVTLLRGTQIAARPRANHQASPGPGDDPDVEIFRADREWFAPRVDEIDLGDLGFLRREVPRRHRREPLPFYLARRIITGTLMAAEMPPREPGFVGTDSVMEWPDVFDPDYCKRANSRLSATRQ